MASDDSHGPISNEFPSKRTHPHSPQSSTRQLNDSHAHRKCEKFPQFDERIMCRKRKVRWYRGQIYRKHQCLQLHWGLPCSTIRPDLRFTPPYMALSLLSAPRTCVVDCTAFWAAPLNGENDSSMLHQVLSCRTMIILSMMCTSNEWNTRQTSAPNTPFDLDMTGLTPVPSSAVAVIFWDKQRHIMLSGVLPPD